MLHHAYETKRTITPEIWNNEFKSHKKKLQFISGYYQMKFPQYKETNEKLSTLLNKLQDEKMRAFYIDWDTEHDKWFFFDKHEQDKEKIAAEALKACDVLIESTVKTRGDFPSETHEEISQLFLAGKTYGSCDKCEFVIMTAEDLKSHNTTCGSKQITWYKVPDGSAIS